MQRLARKSRVTLTHGKNISIASKTHSPKASVNLKPSEQSPTDSITTITSGVTYKQALILRLDEPPNASPTVDLTAPINSLLGSVERRLLDNFFSGLVCDENRASLEYLRQRLGVV